MLNDYIKRYFNDDEIEQIEQLNIIYNNTFPLGAPFPGRVAAILLFADKVDTPLADKIRDKMQKTKKYKEEFDKLYIALGLQLVVK